MPLSIAHPFSTTMQLSRCLFHMSESHWKLIISSMLHYQRAPHQEMHTFISVSQIQASFLTFWLVLKTTWGQSALYLYSGPQCWPCTTGRGYYKEIWKWPVTSKVIRVFELEMLEKWFCNQIKHTKLLVKRVIMGWFNYILMVWQCFL